MSTAPRPATWRRVSVPPGRRWPHGAPVRARPGAGVDVVARLRHRAPVVVGLLVAAVVPAVAAEGQLVALGVAAGVAAAALAVDLLLRDRRPDVAGRARVAGVAAIVALGLAGPGLATGHGQAYRAWLGSLAVLVVVAWLARRRPGPALARVRALVERRSAPDRPRPDRVAHPAPGRRPGLARALDPVRRRPGVHAAVGLSAVLAVAASVANDARTLEHAPGAWSPWWLVAALVLLVVWPFTVWFAPAGTGAHTDHALGSGHADAGEVAVPGVAGARGGAGASADRAWRDPADRGVTAALRDLLASSGPDRSLRATAGLALLVLGAVLALVGYVRLWVAVDLATQLVRLAATALVVVPLSVAGGALVVSGLLRADERRLRALEEAVAGRGATAGAATPGAVTAGAATAGAATAGAATAGAATPRGARRPDAG